MAKVSCPNCKKLTPVIPPAYRCKECEYPLNKVSENNVNINVPGDADGAAHNDEVEININLGDIQMGGDGIGNSDETMVEGQQPNQPAAAKKPEVIKKVLNSNPEKVGQVVAGWLVIHTEEKEPKSYDLFIGDNFFGTAAEGFAVDVPVKDDKYVSRSHANIRITKDFIHRFKYELLDDGSRRPQGASLNGTYINGNTDRLPSNKCIFLKDNDTIQVGETKLVFKTVAKSHDLKEAATAVLNSDYTSTVILSKL